jgi:hypothetical protein
LENFADYGRTELEIGFLFLEFSKGEHGTDKVEVTLPNSGEAKTLFVVEVMIDSCLVCPNLS